MSLTWHKHSQLFSILSPSLVADVHPSVSPHHMLQDQNTGRVPVFHSELGNVVIMLEPPADRTPAGTGDGQGGVRRHDDLAVARGDLQATELGAEVQKSCSQHNKERGQAWGQIDSLRSKVKVAKTTEISVQLHGDEGYEVSGANGEGGVNDALLMTDGGSFPPFYTKYFSSEVI